MSTEQNLAVLYRAIEHWNAGHFEGYLSLYATDAVLHGYAGLEPGIAGIRHFYQQFWAAFPHSQILLEEVLTTDDRVICRFCVQGKHAGPFQGIPATGREFHLSGITILRFENAQCVERWSMADFLGLLQQLGVLPPMA